MPTFTFLVFNNVNCNKSYANNLNKSKRIWSFVAYNDKNYKNFNDLSNINLSQPVYPKSL